MFVVTMMTAPDNQEASMTQENKKRKRQPKKGNGFKVPRKENFMKKIMKNDTATKESSFLKRKPTLITKARQLQQFCSVSVGLVVQSPDGSVDTWPENRGELEGLIWLYRGLDKRRKKEFKLLEFLADKKRKLEKKKDKAVREKVDQLVADASAWLDGLSGDSLVDSVNFLNQKVVDLKEKIKLLEDVESKGKQVVLDVGDDRNNCYDNFDSQIIANGAPSSGPSMTLDDSAGHLNTNINNFLAQGNFGVCNNFAMDNKIENAKLVTEYNWPQHMCAFANNGNVQTSESIGNMSGLQQTHQNIADEGSNFGGCSDYRWLRDLDNFGNMDNSLPCGATSFTTNDIVQARQSNFGLTVEEEMLNDNMLLANPVNLHVSPLHELLPNSVWSPWL